MNETQQDSIRWLLFLEMFKNEIIGRKILDIFRLADDYLNFNTGRNQLMTKFHDRMIEGHDLDKDIDDNLYQELYRYNAELSGFFLDKEEQIAIINFIVNFRAHGYPQEFSEKREILNNLFDKRITKVNITRPVVCSICTENIYEEAVKTFNCKCKSELFHEKCLNTWLNLSPENKCPICRQFGRKSRRKSRRKK